MKVIKAVLSGYTYCEVALLTLLSLSIFSTSTSVNAQKAPYFSCKNKQGTWTTVVATKQGEKNFIYWDSMYFAPSNYTPEKRCNQVTGRLNTYFNGTSELYISNGRMNNQPVICITNNIGGSCQKLLYTLKPGQDGEKAIDLLIRYTESNFDSPPFSANMEQVPYFSCKNKQGIWTTVFATKQGEKNFISWDSMYLAPSNYTPETRCNQVTGRLNTFFNGTSEQYIASGRMNNQPIICVTNNSGGSCRKLLFTLNSGQDGEKVVDLLVQHTESNFNLPPLNVGASFCHTYSSLNELLGDKTKAKKICNYRSSNPARESGVVRRLKLRV